MSVGLMNFNNIPFLLMLTQNQGIILDQVEVIVIISEIFILIQ